ncbi:putative nucleotide-diphospho-sugar transferase [Desulfonatronospira sp.]|uniref:putative nucleotide-diphospho-sugar transferase n=1 Tax=Desulfonatronospira sp. TaxID=1962951 RepID=UPI0025BDCE56|nr:putative nucleotide-diphospho-sugar transferase [Desulfonatronospira sp.]
MNHDNMTQNGLIYVAFGYEYLLMAAYSAYTAKKHNPDISCTVVTNLKISHKERLNTYFDHIHEENLENKFNRHIKTSIIEYAPFIKGAYLDCDTEVRGDLSPILSCLERFDVVLKLNPHPSVKDYRISQDIHGSEFPMWNGGVVFFRNNKSAQRLLADWKKYFLEMGKKSDQPALARAIFENPDIRVLSVNYVWNTFPTDLALKKRGQSSKCRIWHYRNPQDFPEVAKNIYEHHSHISSAIQRHHGLDQEIERIERRYSMLASPYYQSELLRPFYLKFLKILSKLRLTEMPSLSRAKHTTGQKFKRLE